MSAANGEAKDAAMLPDDLEDGAEQLRGEQRAAELIR